MGRLLRRAWRYLVAVLSGKLDEVSDPKVQIDQAKMQEQLNRAMAGMTELAAPGDTPSLDEVRDKIEGRYARALGEAELQSTSIEARMIQVERASIDAEGAARLESIREGLGLPSPSATPEVEPSKKAPSDGS